MVDFAVDSGDLQIDHSGKHVVVMLRYIPAADVNTVMVGYTDSQLEVTEVIYNSGEVTEAKLVAAGGPSAFLEGILPAINAVLLSAFPPNGNLSSLLDQLDQLIRSGMRLVPHSDGTLTVERKP